MVHILHFQNESRTDLEAMLCIIQELRKMTNDHKSVPIRRHGCCSMPKRSVISDPVPFALDACIKIMYAMPQTPEQKGACLMA